MGGRFTREDFLEALYQEYFKKKGGGFILVKSSSHLDRRVSTRYFPNLDSLARERYTDDQQVFFGVCPRERMKPDREQVKRITALWAGYDVGSDGFSGKEKHFQTARQAQAALQAFPLPPSIIVNSGRGKHMYWLLTEPREIEDPDRMDEILGKISKYFQCAVPVNIDACLRLPDTWNPKEAMSPRICSVEHLDPNARYELERFDGLDLRIVIPSKRSPQPSPTPIKIPGRIKVVDDPPPPREWEIHAEEPISEAPDVPFGPAETPDPAATETDPSEAAGKIVVSDPSPPPTHDPEPRYSEPAPAEEQPEAAPLSDDDVDRIAEKLADKLSDRIMDDFTDRIVTRLLVRLSQEGNK